MSGKFYITGDENANDICVKDGYDAHGNCRGCYDRSATLQEITTWFDERDTHLLSKCLEAEVELGRHRTEFIEFLQAEIAKRETKP